jgi:hypothetical protein
MSPVTEPVWQTLPIAALVQFPWRLLGLIVFTMAIVSGTLLTTSKDKPTVMTSRIYQTATPLYLLSLVIILASFSYTLPQYTEVPAWSETPLAVVNWDRASIVDRVGMVSVTEEQPQTSPMEQEYLSQGHPLTVAGLTAGSGTVETLHHGGATDEVRVIAATPVTLQFYTYDYPGWQVTLKGQALNHRHEPPYGLITVDLPAGEHVVRLHMGHTLPRIWGTIISGVGLLVIVGLIFFYLPPLRLNFDN